MTDKAGLVVAAVIDEFKHKKIVEFKTCPRIGEHVEWDYAPFPIVAKVVHVTGLCPKDTLSGGGVDVVIELA